MKAKAFAKLDAKWSRILADDGVFQDLESLTDRDAPLSNRGKLHLAGGAGGAWTAATKASGDSADVGSDMLALADRVEGGSTKTTWAMDVWRTLNSSTPEGRQRKRIWGRYANGESLKSIGRSMELNFHVVRDTVKSIEEDAKRCQEKEATKPDLQKLARQMDSKLLTQTLAALLIAMQRQS